ncbi:MAG: metallophosphoesterase [Oscillatoriales cyanobacterium]|nr:MAG: metallophosphoesterase [Oscillatoriales cyanobacterium]TAH20039.1 MAG: metallophosphoesterase [Oscillatoriales cyanobacterium]
MSIKRRYFLILASLSSLGLAGIWKMSQLRTSWGTDANAAEIPGVEGERAIAPLPTTPPILRFISIADTGTGAQGQYAVAEAMAQYHSQNSFNLAILAGDNIYNNGEFEKINAVFERPYQPLLKQGVKFYACLGNHDIRTANGDLQVKYAAFNMQGRYYTFRRESVQFFALDTNDNADWKNQLVWLEKELSQSTAPWKVVFGHHQIYSAGIYGLNQPFIKVLTPMFQKYGVQLYINGHEHSYERTRSINGTTYLICGAGAGTRPVGRSEWTEYSASRLSFATFDVYEDRMFVSGIGTDKRVFDRGVIEVRSA